MMLTTNQVAETMQSYTRRYDETGYPVTVTGTTFAEALDLVQTERDWVIRLKNGTLIFSHHTGDKALDNNPIAQRVWRLLFARKARSCV